MKTTEEFEKLGAHSMHSSLDRSRCDPVSGVVYHSI